MSNSPSGQASFHEAQYKRGTIERDGKLYGYYPDGTLYRIYDTTSRPFITFHSERGITTMRVRQATELGYAEVPVNGCADIAYPSSALRRSRTVGGGCLVNALTCSQNLVVLVEL